MYTKQGNAHYLVTVRIHVAYRMRMHMRVHVHVYVQTCDWLRAVEK